METLLNLIVKHGESILLGIISFWTLCAVVVGIWMPIEINNALYMDEENILVKRK